MIEPKVFYRELDAILAQIAKGKVNQNFFRIILSEIEQKFGSTLNIRKSHIYEQRGDEFVLIGSSGSEKSQEIAAEIHMESEAVRLVLKHGSYIYDSHKLAEEFDMKPGYGYIVPAAISFHVPERQWLRVFELESGWTEEEITLFLNALRTALNYRILSEMIGTELERAVQIQKSLLPRKAPEIEGYEMAGRSQAAQVVGGDFFDYFQYEDNEFGVSIGDASGHGLPAALLIRDVAIGLRMGLAKEMRMVHTIKKLNQVIQRSTYVTSFVSLFVGEIESGSHFFYVNAGHPAPFVVKGEKIEELGATGITLGFMPEMELHRAFVSLEPESVLVLYSDGLIERERAEDEQYGIERLKKFVTDNQQHSAEELVNLIFKDVFDFGDRKGWDDDATLVVIKRKG